MSLFKLYGTTIYCVGNAPSAFISLPWQCLLGLVRNILHFPPVTLGVMVILWPPDWSLCEPPFSLLMEYVVTCRTDLPKF